MQEISMKTTAQIYDFSELQKKKRQRELREKRPFFITGAVLIISLLSVCFFLYFQYNSTFITMCTIILPSLH